MENSIEYAYWVATQFNETTKGFHTQIEALIYFDGLEEAAVLWDYSENEDGEVIKHNY